MQVSDVVKELAPARIEVNDTVAIRSSLDEHGFACVRAAVTPDELVHAICSGDPALLAARMGPEDV